ncbi:monovalent cation/H+ antiporter complex subunit F [Lachnoclostridium sp. Marseille-P6806]|uniref:monovalent cation/H+ antiporter complex subunit F n=1 Tax=Lachnoclostridium sp. Marseille-P6806 TaxID=2364793 RepID=UPI00102F7C70|nr:monovalent cation/H+ antiporter complex subunit F [Lachnoclostridium sp. Marseille-P6806]
MTTILLIGALGYAVLGLLLLIRIAKGPTAADRLCAADTLDLITATALVLYSLYCGRAIYLDIALIVAILGFISTVFISRYLEGRV